MQISNYFDLVILILTLFLALKGVMNGFIKEIFGLIGIIGGIFLAFKYGNDVGIYIDTFIFNFDSSGAISLAGFVATLFGVWIAVVIVGFFINKLITVSGLGVIDRLFGFVIGGAKIFLLFSVIIYSLSQIEIVKLNTKEYVQNSFFYPLLIECGSFLVRFDPVQITKEPLNTLNDKNTSKQVVKRKNEL